MSFQAIQAMESQANQGPKPEQTDDVDEFFVKIMDNPNFEGLSNEEKRILASEAALD